MILMIDNYDSFTYNLVQYLGELGAEVEVFRNDCISLDEIEDLKPSHIVISPGPGTPDDAGVSLELIRRFGGQIPLFGVCLGHQSIAQAYGGHIIHAPILMHGKTSMIHHDGSGIFEGLDSPFQATRYHSLVAEPATLPQCFDVTAWTDDNQIMGIQHKHHAVFGVQFHPESILTQHGHAMLGKFLEQTA